MPGTKMEPEGWASKEKVGGVGHKKSNHDRLKKESGWGTSQGQCWASYSNTPFRKFKKLVHEGGIATPLIAHWPRGIASSGGIASTQAFHFMDFMPTLLEVAVAEYPVVFHGKNARRWKASACGPPCRNLPQRLKSGCSSANTRHIPRCEKATGRSSLTTTVPTTSIGGCTTKHMFVAKPTI